MKNSLDEDRENHTCIPIDFILPFMESVLPDGFVLSEEAVVAVQECVSEFAAYIVDETIESCECDCKSTVCAEDLINTVQSLGLEKYLQPLKIFSKKLRNVSHGDSMKGTVEEEDKNVIGEAEGNREGDFVEGSLGREGKKLENDNKGDRDFTEGVSGEDEKKINGGTKEWKDLMEEDEDGVAHDTSRSRDN